MAAKAGSFSVAGIGNENEERIAERVVFKKRLGFRIKKISLWQRSLAF